MKLDEPSQNLMLLCHGFAVSDWGLVGKPIPHCEDDTTSREWH